jgi:hypothetical protein
MAESPAADPAAKPTPPIKKGSLVKVNRQAYSSSIEAQASDTAAPAYLFEGPAEVLVIKGEHAQLRFRRPVPDVWLRADQLESF